MPTKAELRKIANRKYYLANKKKIQEAKRLKYATVGKKQRYTADFLKVMGEKNII